MKRSILFLLIGLLIGAVASTYFLGAYHARALPGVPLRPPDQNSDGSGTVAVSIDEKFFDALLATIFQKLGPPQLKLSQNSSDDPMRRAVFQSSCANTVVLAAEGGNVKTGVKFTGGKIIAPLAFSGSYSVLTNCIQFKGTAKATVDLSFSNEKQTVFGQLNVDEVVLDGTSPIVSSLVTAFVRKTIAERLNAFEVLRVSQLALSVPIEASGGSLKARVKDVRAEVQEGSLRLLLIYDFSAEKNGAG
jgi:hypothetical protein